MYITESFVISNYSSFVVGRPKSDLFLVFADSFTFKLVDFSQEEENIG